tara:strand:- start:1113 stop:2048 length:936 start_codon:yes stop_codon:yes gene_type:complete
MRLSDIDLRSLEVFIAVVEAQGIANAQALLNRDASTISRQLGQLEERIGLRLCERGRGGFALTGAGEQIYRNTVDLTLALRRFEDAAETLKGHLSGKLRLAMIDNLISDPNCPLRNVLQRYGARRANEVHLHMEVMAPFQIEQALLNHAADVGIGIFPAHLEELDYQPLYQETDWLVCAPSHPLAGADSLADVQEVLQTSAKVARHFLGSQDTTPLGGDPKHVSAWVSNVEAAALLILAGSHVGFLPNHYARVWIESGQMVAVRPDHFRRSSLIEAAARRSRDSQTPAVDAFRDDMAAVLEVFGMPASTDR